MNLAIMQLSTLPMNDAKFDYYARICQKKGIEVILLGEYVLNSFFKELENMERNIIKEQTSHKINMLKSIAAKYNVTIVAPIVRTQKDKLYKSTIKATSGGLKFYDQQFLINYKHWNEEKFFANDTKKEYKLDTFTQNGMKFAIVLGFELHFDYIWEEIDRKKVDVVLMPSISTFQSKQRWDELLKMRAFTHNVYILRANRIGSYKQKEGDWHFYGHSGLINPHGEFDEYLNDEEAMLVVSADKKVIKEARSLWGWRKQKSKKGLI